MPSTSDLGSLMCYQLNKFERTTVAAGAGPHAAAVPAPPDPAHYPAPLAIHNYENVISNPLNSVQGLGRRQGQCPCGSPAPYPTHTCPDCERETKRARSRVFGSGGRVFVDKNHGYANTRWASFEEATGAVEPPPPLLRRRGSQASDGSEGSGKSRLQINVNLPPTIDFDYALKSQKFSINIRLTEAKSPGGGGTNRTNDMTSLLERTRHQLARTGWYYQGVDWQESIRILHGSPVGTFFLRDSGDPRYLFSLSLQTPRGPISSRISYSGGKFRLDSQERIVNLMPSYSNVIDLIQHYTKFGIVKDPAGRQVWVDATGQTFSPVQLSQPLRKEVGSLQHLARLAVNRELPLLDKSVPEPIKSYLAQYPYTF